jgi:hypothetical protein
VRYAKVWLRSTQCEGCKQRTLLVRPPSRRASRATPATLTADLNLLGFLFESLAVLDLRIHAQRLDGSVLHWYTRPDGVLVLPVGALGP